jgi:hypothetical protein
MRQVFPTAKIISGNTDSLCLEILDEKNSFISDLSKLGDIIDFSSLDTSHELYSKNNENVEGMWKIIDLEIIQFIALGPSSYSYLPLCKYCKLKCSENCPECSSVKSILGKRVSKGLPKNVRRRLSHDNYVNYYKTHKSLSFKHNKLNVKNSKLSLQELTYRPFQNIMQTRHFIGDTSLPFGHCKIKKDYPQIVNCNIPSRITKFSDDDESD